MPRYSRRPISEVTNIPLQNFDTIVGSIITRQWDEGELLIIGDLSLQNLGAAVHTVELRFAVDGIVLARSLRTVLVPVTGQDQNRQVTIISLHPIAAGVHTVAFQGREVGIAGDVVTGDGGGEFIVIQLPLWDSDADLN